LAEPALQTEGFYAPTIFYNIDLELSDDPLQGILGDQGFQDLQDFQRMQPLQSQPPTK
jgi:hypothetical protein